MYFYAFFFYMQPKLEIMPAKGFANFRRGTVGTNKFQSWYSF